MPGLDKLLRNIMNYHSTMRPAMVKQLEQIRDKPEPKGVMFSCMDSRLLMTRMLQSEVGEMFLVRNAGNMVAHIDSLTYDSVTTEPGALELGCVINNIRQVMVCGHSDCKAMNLLHSIRDKVQDPEGTPLQLWLKKHGKATVQKYNQWKEAGSSKPVTFVGETTDKIMEAYIDPEDKFGEADKFSQINTLQQLQNIASHPIIFDKLRNKEVDLTALWFDIHQGQFYMFSRERKQFLVVDKSSYEHLQTNGNSFGR